MQTTLRYIEFSVFVFLTIFLYFSGNIFWSSIGLSLFVMFSLRFFNNLGRSVDIRVIIIILSSLQWIVGPYFAYRFYVSEYGTYDMVTPENIYMAFVVPATTLFFIGLFIPFKLKIDTSTALLKISNTMSKYKNLDFLFIITGLFFNIIWKQMPGALLFISFLFGNLHFIGLLLLLQNKERKNRKTYLVFTFLFTFLSALNSGMFHDLILWFGFMFLFISYMEKISFVKKLTTLLSMVILIIVLQTVKAQFREIIWSEDNKTTTSSAKAELFYDLVSKNVGGSFLMSQENINNLVSRINQGWIISRIMSHVPTYEPFANGETIIQGIEATLLPRFLNSNKVKAGDSENFVRFTGRELLHGTSMGMSVVGESYANFGKQGGIVFMFFFGLFLNLAYLFIISKLKTRPILLFFIPIIFLQVVKAESNFVIVLNHLVKSTIFVFLVLWGLKTFLNVKNI